MRLMNLFATETDSDGAGHDVCSVALLKNRTTRSYVDMQVARASIWCGWVDNEDLKEMLD